MARQWSSARRRDDESSVSPGVSRLVILVFVVAAVLGLTTGVIWVAWSLVRH